MNAIVIMGHCGFNVSWTSQVHSVKMLQIAWMNICHNFHPRVGDELLVKENCFSDFVNLYYIKKTIVVIGINEKHFFCYSFF